MLATGARARAAIEGRDYVIPDDVKALAVGVLAHRLIVKSQASLREIDPDAIVREIVSQVPVGQPSPLSATAG
jgi:MoxR-like ATPase